MSSSDRKVSILSFLISSASKGIFRDSNKMIEHAMELSKGSLMPEATIDEFREVFNEHLRRHRRRVENKSVNRK